MTTDTKTWRVYILELRNGAFYTGITNDLEARIKKHKEGTGSKYVRAHLPLCLVYVEEAGNRSEATRREREIKKFKRVKKLDLIIRGGLRMADEKKCGGGGKKCCERDDKDCDTSKDCDKDCDCDQDCEDKDKE